LFAQSRVEELIQPAPQSAQGPAPVLVQVMEFTATSWEVGAEECSEAA
jgi:hypothetical protein